MRKCIKAEIYEPVYGTTIYLFSGDTKQAIFEMETLIKKHDTYQNLGFESIDDAINDGSNGFFRKLSLKKAIIWFKDITPSIYVVSHECVHAAAILIGQRGMQIEENFDEPAAYYVGYLVSQICTHLNVKTKYKKKVFVSGVLE